MSECPSITCNLKFKSEHYTHVIPHLETHTIKELTSMVHSLLIKLSWASTMGDEIISKAETLNWGFID